MPIAVIIELLGLLPTLIQAGVSLMPVITKIVSTVNQAQANGRAPTDAEWQALIDHAKSLKSG